MCLVVTAPDYAEAVNFYRDVLGLPERASCSSPDGQVVILEAGRATLEIADPAQAEFIDRVEVGRRVVRPHPGRLRGRRLRRDGEESRRHRRDDPGRGNVDALAGPERPARGTRRAAVDALQRSLNTARRLSPRPRSATAAAAVMPEFRHGSSSVRSLPDSHPVVAGPRRDGFQASRGKILRLARPSRRSSSAGIRAQGPLGGNLTNSC